MKNFDYSKLTGEQKSQAEQIKKSASKYQGKSQAELFAELDKMKKRGEISPQKLEAFKTKVMPMLNKEQQKRLEGILSRLKQ